MFIHKGVKPMQTYYFACCMLQCIDTDMYESLDMLLMIIICQITNCVNGNYFCIGKFHSNNMSYIFPLITSANNVQGTLDSFYLSVCMFVTDCEHNCVRACCQVMSAWLFSENLYTHFKSSETV